MLQFHGSHLGLSIKIGLVTGIISLTEGIAVGRTFTALENYKIDGNKEMIAIGLMNMVGSFTYCYVTTGAFSRSIVNHNAGAKTAMSNIVMSAMVLFLMPLFEYTPNVVLGAIIVSAVVSLIDVPEAFKFFKVDRFDFVVMLYAFFEVFFVSVQEGLAIAVGQSLFKILMQMTRPKTVLLGNIPGTYIFRDLNHYKESMKILGFLILSIEAPINFVNSTYLNKRVLRWIDDYEAEYQMKHLSLRFVIFDMSAVSGIYTSGVAFFKELKKTVENKGVEIVLVNPLGEVMENLLKSDENGNFMRPDCLFLTVGEAVAALSAIIKCQLPIHVV